MPDSMSRRGESKAPAHRITSPASMRLEAPPPKGCVSTPETVPRGSTISRSTTVSEITVRLGRLATGATNAWYELFRRPFEMFERFQPKPSSVPSSNVALRG